MPNWRLQRAREARFEALVLPHLETLHCTALRLTRDASNAEDLVQETFLRAFRAIHQLTQEDSCRAWLVKTMTNSWLNQRRKQSREAPAIDVYELDPSHDEVAVWSPLSAPETPEAVASRRQFCEDVDKSLQQLPEAFRIVVILADLEGMSYKEVAETLQRPIGTIMSRLYRARLMLRKALWRHARHSQENGFANP